MEQLYINGEQLNYKFCLKDVKRFLIEKFLYDNDSESLNILLNIYQIEESVNNICPTYISLKHLKKDILKFLKDKEGIDLIANNLSSLIHDDVNRFELYVYLEGYRSGINAKKSVNLLEIMTCKYFTIEELYNMKKLFNKEILKPEILELKAKVLNDFKNDSNVKKQIYDLVFKFNLKVLKRKVYNLNAHVDKQLVFNLDGGKKFKETNSNLTRRELKGLNKKIVRFLYLDGIRIFENAYWEGINDQVIKRYK
ncbi:hypothetical protein [Peptoniphilus indolicus]|uniref:Uncharacterized protein n=2 Tax=Peptoniphilus indolicus TaxID=33030 RepID=G4D5U3_9FIRM|nr:hypothetical protein [Peptoniphilus indolicus]EGY78151.1 hypothetical protein HMPREF9129_1773 [Peptoniphilus indolicus ATCC 29427]SUB76148.1 Uncharacterised protein [Peptoniphilus indolicus]